MTLGEPKPKVTLSLGGKDYELPPFNLNLMVEIEDAFGSFEGMTKEMDTKRMGSTRKLLSILLKGYPELTESKIGDLVDLTNMADVSNQIAKTLGG